MVSHIWNESLDHQFLQPDSFPDSTNKVICAMPPIASLASSESTSTIVTPTLFSRWVNTVAQNVPRCPSDYQ